MPSFTYPPQPGGPDQHWDFQVDWNGVTSGYEPGQNQPTITTHSAYYPPAETLRMDVPPTTAATEFVNVLHRRVISGTCCQLPNSIFYDAASNRWGQICQ